MPKTINSLEELAYETLYSHTLSSLSTSVAGNKSNKRRKMDLDAIVADIKFRFYHFLTSSYRNIRHRLWKQYQSGKHEHSDVCLLLLDCVLDSSFTKLEICPTISPATATKEETQTNFENLLEIISGAECSKLNKFTACMNFKTGTLDPEPQLVKSLLHEESFSAEP